MSAETEAALIAAVVSLVALLVSYYQTRIELREQRTVTDRQMQLQSNHFLQELAANKENLAAELQAQKEAVEQEVATTILKIRSLFRQDLVNARLQCYAPVFTSLGAIPDTSVHHKEFIASPQKLDEIKHSVATELKAELYGPAGLLMEYDTRNWIHRAAIACTMDFPKIHFEDLVGVFFVARRYLRSDLGLRDLDDNEWPLYRHLVGTENINLLEIRLKKLIDLGHFRDPDPKL